tara:strand:+ start:1305 stop:2000 length:696 start_codon:yes stop_codon:yes gene_type:complete
MSELTTAQNVAENILNRARQTFWAIKMQKMWKIKKERMTSIQNKKANTIVVPEDYVGTMQVVHVKRNGGYKYVSIPDPKEETTRKRKVRGVDFNCFMETRTPKKKNGTDMVDMADGVDKDITIFAKLVEDWVNTKNREVDFFDRKKCLKDQDKCGLLINETLEKLHNDEKIILWKNQGNLVTLYPLEHKRIIQDFHTTWNLRIYRKEIKKMKEQLTRMMLYKDTLSKSQLV